MPQPEPPVAEHEERVPNACLVHPEQIVEHEYFGLLSDELHEEIADREEGHLDAENASDSSGPASYATYEEYEAAMAAASAEEPDEIDYMSDLSLAPGWKADGFASGT
ncbi:hypothetical protein AB0K49_25345 [Streptomyces decoyicus]|uniref:hypothetical protein n=1 Tax=Streptomyces decoyicus TaxID=249567 RepID=UPI00345C6ED9